MTKKKYQDRPEVIGVRAINAAIRKFEKERGIVRNKPSERRGEMPTVDDVLWGKPTVRQRTLPGT